MSDDAAALAARKDNCSECTEESVNVMDWYEKNRDLFSPPICNKLMHKQQMTVMFVGGPNRRRDFHLDRGSEFFYQMKGNMKLPIILPYNKLHIVEIKEGHVFLLPACVPHSPQRPEEGSLGLVVERERYEDEPDGLRYFEGFDFIKHGDEPEKLDVDEILWEKFFWCQSLGQDLVPVVKDFLASEEATTNKRAGNVHSWRRDAPDAAPDRTFEPKFPVNSKIQAVPEPFDLKSWCAQRSEQLQDPKNPSRISLFGNTHPDKEYVVEVHGVGEHSFEGFEEVDSLIMQIVSECKVDRGDGKTFTVGEGSVLVVPRGKSFKVTRQAGHCLFVQQHPRKNEAQYGYAGFAAS